jgi:hypothetical protein
MPRENIASVFEREELVLFGFDGEKRVQAEQGERWVGSTIEALKPSLGM